MDKCANQSLGKGNNAEEYTFHLLVARLRESNPNRELPPHARRLAILCEKQLQTKLICIRDLRYDLLTQLDSIKKSQNAVHLLNAAESVTELPGDLKKMSLIYKSAINCKIQLFKLHETARKALHPTKMDRYSSLIARYIRSLNHISRIALQFLIRPCVCAFTPPPMPMMMINPMATKTMTNELNLNLKFQRRGWPRPTIMATMACRNELHTKLTEIRPFFQGLEILQTYLFSCHIFAQIILHRLAWAIIIFYYTLTVSLQSADLQEDQKD